MYVCMYVHACVCACIHTHTGKDWHVYLHLIRNKHRLSHILGRLSRLVFKCNDFVFKIIVHLPFNQLTSHVHIAHNIRVATADD